jgi:undecaprenyl-diphosphatase
MTVWEGILLGVLQGLTEFLPVSSSGHLALAEHFFDIESPGVVFEVFVHFGTALAVICYFRRRIAAVVVAALRWLFRMDHDAADARTAWHLILGTIPAGVIGYLVADRVEAIFERAFFVAIFLVATGVVLWLTRRLRPGWKEREGVAEAVGIGFAQAAAILPGVSRSGATIATGLLAGVRRERAAEFAFLLSVPVILGATLVSIGDAIEARAAAGAAITAGTIAAFASALPAIFVLMRLVTAGRFYRFAYYCWGVGIAALVLVALGY